MEKRNSYEALVKASKVRWRNHANKIEQIKFIHMLNSPKFRSSKGFKSFLWKRFFPMLSWKMFLELYSIRKMKSKKIENLSKKLFSKEKAIHGGCIFTLIAGAIASIAASASAAAGTVAATAGAVTSAVAGSSIASAAAVGVVTGAATIAGEEIVKAAIK